jgi:HEPN domain-containing protein
MPPKQRDPTEGAEWLRRARSNLALARAGRSAPEVLYEDLCFEAQQAAEKAIKALLIDRKVAFPKTHAIMDLLTILALSGVAVPEEIRRAGLLTGYAVETRYPGLSEEVTKEDYAQALELAERVVRWAEALLSPGREEQRS